MNRRRLFGMLTAVAGVATVSEIPRTAEASLVTRSVDLTVRGTVASADPPESFVSVLRVDRTRLLRAIPLDDRKDHVCQCFNCTLSIQLPPLQFSHLDESGAAKIMAPLHEGHFGIRLWRPTYRDWTNGVRLKVAVNGVPISTEGLFETIAGEDGRVWAYTSPGRHVCHACGVDVCVTQYRGRVTVEVVVPSDIAVQATMRSLVTG
jgi:hypothetical protein